MCRSSKTEFLRELNNILLHDTARQDMLFSAYLSLHTSMMLGMFLTHGLIFGLLAHVASASRDSHLAYVLMGMAIGPSLVLFLLLFISVGRKFYRRHFFYLFWASGVLQSLFFVLVKVHCSNMRIRGDPRPFSGQLLDITAENSFWCTSPGNSFVIWIVELMACLPMYLGPFTLVESMSCLAVTIISLLAMAILEDDELKFTYIFFALFTLCANALFKVMLVAKEYVLHMSVPGRHVHFRRHSVSSEELDGEMSVGSRKRPTFLWDDVPITSTDLSLLADLQMDLHSSQQNGWRSKLHVTDFLSQTSNDLLSCIATMSTAVDFLRSCNMSDVGRHWWMLEAHRTMMQRMMTMIVSQQDFVSIVRKQTISRPSMERVSVENLLKDIAGLTQQHFFRHVLKIRYVIDKRIADRPILSDLSWLRHMLMICLSHARNTRLGEKGNIEVRALLLDVNHNSLTRDLGGREDHDIGTSGLEDGVSIRVVEAKHATETSDKIAAEGRPSFEPWAQRPMIRFEIRSTYGDCTNKVAESKSKETADLHRDGFKHDLDSSRLGLFILRFKATLLQGSCAVDPIPGSSTSAGGTNIWFEVPYNAITTRYDAEDERRASRTNSSSSISLEAAAVAASSSTPGAASFVAAGESNANNLSSSSSTDVATASPSISFMPIPSATSLPRHAAETAESPPDLLDELDSVLVVNGDHTAVMVICTVIQSLGIKQIDVALDCEQGEHHMKLRPYSVVFFNPLILPELNDGYVCVKRFRDWEKTHRLSRQFICGISAATGARELCKKAGMDECILKVNSGLHVKSLVRHFRGMYRASLHTEPMPAAGASTDASDSGEEKVTATPTSEAPSQTIDKDIRWDGASLKLPLAKTGKIRPDELDIDIDAFCRQMRNKTGDLHKFIALFVRSGQKIVLEIQDALDRHGDEDAAQKYKDLRNAAHALKGAAMMMYAKPLSRLCFKLEKYCLDILGKSAEKVDKVVTASGARLQIGMMVEDIKRGWDVAVLTLENIS